MNCIYDLEINCSFNNNSLINKENIISLKYSFKTLTVIKR